MSGITAPCEKCGKIHTSWFVNCAECRKNGAFSVGSSDLLATVEKYFKDCRFNNKLHLGLGDIRMTIGMQEHILKLIAEATEQEFNEIG